MTKKKLPKFKDEDQEREFWSSHDSTEYIDWDSAEELILPNLKPSLRTISLRLPEHLLNDLKFLANKKDVPYQSLLKMFLAERVQLEISKLGRNTLKVKEKVTQYKGIPDRYSLAPSTRGFVGFLASLLTWRRKCGGFTPLLPRRARK